MAASIAASVAIAGMPVAGLAEEVEVTIETVKSDETNAQEAVGTAADTVEGLAASELTAEKVTYEDKTSETFKSPVTTSDVSEALKSGNASLDSTQNNISNIEKYANELESTESTNGENVSTGLIPAAEASANTASLAVDDVHMVMEPVYDDDGKPVYILAVDENGNPVFDENGEPVYVQQKDENGNPVFDENGEPVYVQQTKLFKLVYEVDENGNPLVDENGNPVVKKADFADIANDTDTAAGNAISSANTANTSGNENVARTAAQTAKDELATAEKGLKDIDEARKDAQQKVNKAEEELEAAEKAKKEAQAKYEQLQNELRSGQTNATAANEQLKAAGKYMKGLEQAAEEKYLEYIGGEQNLAMLENIDACSKALDDYIATKNLKDDNGKLKGNLDNEFWNRARKLSKALIEYSIKNNEFRFVDGDKKVEFEDGWRLTLGDNFKVTLTTYSVPVNITADDVQYDENGENPYIKLDEKATDYELQSNGKWKDNNVLSGEEKVSISDGMIKVGNDDSRNRVVVTFRDSEGNVISDLPQFYFNYKVNPDGTVYYYQRTFTKVTENVSGNPEAYLVSEGTTGFFKNGDSSNANNNITGLELKKDDVIVDKDENTKLYVHTGPGEEVSGYKPKDKQQKPRDAEQVKVIEAGPGGHNHEKDKEEIKYSIVSYKDQEIVQKTVYKFYYEVTKTTSKNDNAKSGENLSQTDMVDEVKKYLGDQGYTGEIKLNTGNNGKSQTFVIETKDETGLITTKTEYSVIVSHSHKKYSYTIGMKKTKEVKTEKEYIAENSKGYNVKETYKAVKSDPVYAGYESFMNETGIRWEEDKNQPNAQSRAVSNEQLKVDENNKYSNNFDYKKALEYKHLAEQYAEASKAVETANTKTQKLKDDLDKLTLEYNGVKAAEDELQEENKDPESELYMELKELEQQIIELKKNLNNARQELAIAKIERENLYKKVEEARKAVAGIDLSRFDISSDDNGGNDDSGSSDDTTVIATVASNSTATGTQAATGTTLAAGTTNASRNVNAAANGGQAAGEAAGQATQQIGENQTPKSDTPNVKEDNKKTELAKIAENMTPKAATPMEQGVDFNYLWLLALLAAIIITIVAYENNKKKQNSKN